MKTLYPEIHYEGLEHSITLTNLEAFVNYTFTIRACSSGGCGNSQPIIVKTHESFPEKQKVPLILPLSNTSLFVSWEPPEEPNGKLSSF